VVPEEPKHKEAQVKSSLKKRQELLRTPRDRARSLITWALTCFIHTQVAGQGKERVYHGRGDLSFLEGKT